LKSAFDSGRIEPRRLYRYPHTDHHKADTAEEDSPTIHYSFRFAIPLLGVLFLSGYGPILVTIDIRYSTDYERGSIRIEFEKKNEFSTPASSPHPPRPPTPPRLSQPPVIHAPQPTRRPRRVTVPAPEIVVQRENSSPSNYGGLFSRPQSPSPRTAVAGRSTRTNPREHRQTPPLVVSRVRSPDTLLSPRQPN
jgi:hypothetical protein